MSEGLISELEHAVDLMAQSREEPAVAGDGPQASAPAADAGPAQTVFGEADHILGPILAHVAPAHTYTDHLLGPDHTDAPHESANLDAALAFPAHGAVTQLEPAHLEPTFVAEPAPEPASEPAAAPVALAVNPVEAAPAAAQGPVMTVMRSNAAALKTLPATARVHGGRGLKLVSNLHDAEAVVDPVLAGFDHVVALVGYALLFVAIPLLGVPALAAVALAYAHRRDSHVLVSTHYHFQIRIFWTAALLFGLALACTLGASADAIHILLGFIGSRLPNAAGALGNGSAAWTGPLAVWLGVAATVFLVLAVGWTLIASVIGFFRLLGNKPIGHTAYTA
jgi:uncharacterized membrane protein